jgi:hypothetical protein
MQIVLVFLHAAACVVCWSGVISEIVLVVGRGKQATPARLCRPLMVCLLLLHATVECALHYS